METWLDGDIGHHSPKPGRQARTENFQPAFLILHSSIERPVPKVTVIIPAHNRSRVLPRAIASVRAQTFADWELIVVDDASTDDTFAVAQRIAAEDGRIRVMRHERNQGVGPARNTAVAVAAGEWLAFLDSDDEWAPEKLAKQLARAEAWRAQHGRWPGLVYCHARVLSPRGHHHFHTGAHEGMIRDEFFRGFFFVPSTWLVRTDAFRRTRGFDPAFFTGEDSDWMFQFAADNEIAAVSEALVEKDESVGNHLGRLTEWCEPLIRKYDADYRRVVGEAGLAHLWIRMAGSCARRGRRRAAVRAATKAIRLQPAKARV